MTDQPDPIREAIDRGGGQTCDIEGVLRELANAGFVVVKNDHPLNAETIQTLLDLLNPLHGELDRQTYDKKVRENFDAPQDREYNVDITARMESDLTQAVLILENRKQIVS